MINFTLYTANTVGNSKTSVFPNKHVVTDKASSNKLFSLTTSLRNIKTTIAKVTTSFSLM